MYESPISLQRQIDAIHQEINQTVEGAIVSKVREKLHVEIDVRELKKALAYDRGQYEKGFDDGFAKAEEKNKKAEGHWIICPDGYYPYCSKCKAEPPGRAMTSFCPECGARMTGREAES